MDALSIRPTTKEDATDLLTLYRKVASIPDGLIRSVEEITEEYISAFLTTALSNGLTLVGENNGKIIAEIHAHTPDLYAFQHLLTDLTIAVDPDFHGQGVGSRLFRTFLTEVKTHYPHIRRVELYTRAHNLKNVSFYERLGFRSEGAQVDKIYGAQHFETPLQMAWLNPEYNT